MARLILYFDFRCHCEEPSLRGAVIARSVATKQTDEAVTVTARSKATKQSRDCFRASPFAMTESLAITIGVSV